MKAQSKYLAVLLLISGIAIADEHNGWSKLGEALAGGAQADDDAAYMEGRRLGEEIRARKAEKALLDAEADYQRQISLTRLALQRNWQDVGFSVEDAQAIAAAYLESEAEEAVFRRVRQRTDEQLAGDIRRALDEYDFLLANQLLLGWALKRREATAQE